MPRLWLVRHGRAAAGYGTHRDPGLDELGTTQAGAVAARLDPLGTMPILASPLRRARETAQPLELRWDTQATVERGVAEIPAPTDDLEERRAWIREAMASSWRAMGHEQRSWRGEVLETLLGVDRDSVVFTHFVVINVAIGSARCDDAVVNEVVGNGSVTVLDHDGTTLSVVEVEPGDSGRVN